MDILSDPAPRSTVMSPTWDGSPATFADFRKQFMRYIVRAGFPWAIATLNTSNVPKPNRGSSATIDEYKVKMGNATAYVALEDSVTSTTLDQITVNLSEDELNDRDANVLWLAFVEYAKGAVVELSGDELHERIHQWRWPTDNTYTDQVTNAIQQLKAFVEQASALSDPNYPYTEAMATSLFRKLMPDRFQLEHSSYEKIRRLAELATKAMKDAKRFDSRPELDRGFKAMLSCSSSPDTTDTRVSLSTVKQSNMRISRERRWNRTAGPPTDKHMWCEEHGWTFHTSDKCFKLHPELRNVNSNSANDTNRYKPQSTEDICTPHLNQKRYAMIPNGDGTYSQVEVTDPPKAMISIANAMKTCSGESNEILRTPHIYVDCCADFSFTSDISSLRNVEELSHGPIISTFTNSTARATHRGTRTIRAGHIIYDEVCYYVPDGEFNLASTHQMTLAGISVLIDANKDQLYMIPADPSLDPIPCTRINNVWAIPFTNHMVAVTKEHTTDPDDGPETNESISNSAQPQKVDYKWFRLTIGNPSHRMTMDTAKQLNVMLTNSKSAQSELDQKLRIANQRVKPIVPADGLPVEPVPNTSIVTDTIGATFPRSRMGNTTAQTWSDPTDTSIFYITVGPDHSANTTWNGLQQYARDAGIIIPRNMINAGVTIYSDNGTEYTGAAFADRCSDAGIKQSTSTPYKTSGHQPIAESQNARAQQGMRANIVGAQENFKQFKVDANAYWDYAIQYAAKQVQARTAARKGKTTCTQLVRTIPAPWGALGTVTIQPKDPHRQHKQLSTRSATGLLLGTHDHKCIMLLQDGRVIQSSDVYFDPALIHQPYQLTFHNPINNPGDTPGPGGVFSNNLSSTHDNYTQAREENIDDMTTSHCIITDDVTTDNDINTESVSSHQSNSTVAGGGIVDCNGTTIAPGDKVKIYWPEEKEIYSGTFDHVNVDNPATYQVTYDDGIALDHLVTEIQPMKVVRALRVTEKPIHPSVTQYLTETGDINPNILHGHTQLQPMPPYPNITRANAPPNPETVQEALSSPHAIFWLHAIVKEYIGHISPDHRPATFKYTTEDIKTNVKPLGAKWVFTIKFNGNTIEKFKARLCVAGFGLKRGLDFVESYTGTAPIGDLRLLEVLALLLDLYTYEDDLTMAYCHVPMPTPPSGQSVIMKPTKGTRVFTDDGKLQNNLLQMALYGHPASGFALAREICDKLTNRNLKEDQIPCPIPIKQSDDQPVIFRAIFDYSDSRSKEIFWIWINNDNIRCYTSSTDIYNTFREWLCHAFAVTGSTQPLCDIEPQTTLGMQIQYCDGSVRLEMPAFINKLLIQSGMIDCNPASTPLPSGFTLSKQDIPVSSEEQERVRSETNKLFGKHHYCETWEDVKRLYAHFVSSFGWIAKQVGPSLSLTVSILGRVMHGPSTEAFQAVKRVLRFLRGNDMALTYKRKKVYNWREGDLPKYIMKSDSSFADDSHNRRSQGGYVGGFEDVAPDNYASQQSKRVCTSTHHAESYFGSVATRQAEYTRSVLMFLGVNRGESIELQLDNYATVISSAAPIRKFSQASKAFHIDDKYLAQAVELGIIHVRHVTGSIENTSDPNNGFTADAMTKPLSPILFKIYKKQLQGET